MSCGLNTEDVHQIAYLTMNGWEYTSYSGWKKVGFTRTVKEWAGGSHYKDVETDSFDDTSEAYSAERRVSDG